MSIDLGRESLDAPSTPRAATEHINTPSRATTEGPPARDADLRARLDRVLQSDIGINTLLTRLKQSISSARELSGFLKERAALEEKHFHGVLRLTKTTQDVIGRPENRQGSFAQNYREVGVIHERMAKNSEDFAQHLLTMSEELQELASHCERGRKQWKHTGLEAEQRAQDADSAMEKAKQRYHSFAEQYDRVRTGERQGGKFGLKGPKSAAQQEESLLSKAENADQEYRSRVEAAQAQRQELLSSSRPQAIRELQQLIMECDAAMSMQMQKFAVLNEKLLLGNGLCVSPFKNNDNTSATSSRSLREVAQGINDHKDFEDYVLSHHNRVGPPPSEIRYEKHSAFAPTQQQQVGPPSSNFTTSTPLPRSDTGLSTTSGLPHQHGQTTGVISHQTTPSQGQYSGVQNTNPSSAPQLPQIGSLSMGPGNKFEGTRTEPPEYRSQTDLPSYRQDPTNNLGHSDSLSSGSINQQVTSVTSPTGLGAGRGQPLGTNAPYQTGSVGFASGRGQPLATNAPYQTGSVGPGTGRGQSLGTTAAALPYGSTGTGLGRGQQPFGANTISQGGLPATTTYGHDSRSTSLGQSNDFRQDGRSVQSGPDYSTQQAGKRLSQLGPSIPGQSTDSRTLQSGPNFQTSQHDMRGLPSQTSQHDIGSLPIRGSQHDMGGISSQYSSHNPTGSLSTYGASGTARNGNNKVGSTGIGRGPGGRPSLPPLRPVFGVPLDELFRRDGEAVPMIVYKCIQAVDTFGLNTEGLYRISGSAQHIMELQALFDHDAAKVDFRSPANFHNDIASVTTLLKHFLRDLPDPLLTSAQYNSFIQAAKMEEDIVRRDSLHAIINSLPDPNYATLRTLTLHLNRVAQRSTQNRMTTSNLAIVFGPTLMGGHGAGPGGDIQDAGWQAIVIETILNNTLQIFDDDD